MNEKIDVGCKVILGNLTLTVKRIYTQNVKTVRAGVVALRKLYFLENHSPIYDYEVNHWIDLKGVEHKKGI